MHPLSPAHLNHARLWQDFRYCYPVISRRCKGLSLGVNICPSKKCNFGCVYCEVDRDSPPGRGVIDMSRLKDEMEHLMDLSISGQIFAMLPFSAARKEHQRFNDLCFSGDAEPTTSDRFHETVGLLANLMKCHELNAVKLILITNATMLQDGNVIDAIDMLMQSNGEIWAKLDAGTPEHYQAINRSDISFDQILSNLEFAGRRWPLTIQTMMLEWKGQWPLDRELASYVNRIKRQMDSGAQIQKIQLYTVARPTPEPEALPLPPPILDKIANFVMGELAGLPVEVFYGSSI